jgi:hypothetical protein
VTSYQGSSAAGSTYHIYEGNSTGINGVGGYLILKTHWSGSEGGIADLNGTQETFLQDVGTGGVLFGDQHGTTPAGGQLTAPTTVQVAMADNSVIFSRTPAADVVGNKLGIITFKYVLEKGSVASITDVKDTQFRASLKFGGANLSLWTGNDADHTKYVYITGRDNSSGTRVNNFGWSQFGIFNGPQQIEVNANGTMHDNTGGGVYIGDYGYSSGGSVAAQMGFNIAGQADLVHAGAGQYSVIGYLGNDDAVTAVNVNGATLLTYNGQAFSQANIENGLYTAWGYEYVYEGSADSGTGDAPDQVLNAITSELGALATTDSYIQNSAMNVTRVGPTTDPIHK